MHLPLKGEMYTCVTYTVEHFIRKVKLSVPIRQVKGAGRYAYTHSSPRQ